MTWSGKRNIHLVQSWIDSALGNDEWRATFPASYVTYLEMIEYDHRTAIIQIRRNAEYGKRCFVMIVDYFGEMDFRN